MYKVAKCNSLVVLDMVHGVGDHGHDPVGVPLSQLGAGPGDADHLPGTRARPDFELPTPHLAHF